MRVTEQQRYHAFTSQMQMRLSNMLEIQGQLGTGRSLQVPSDDVFRAGRTLHTEESIARNAQFKRNVEDGQNWIQAADGKLQAIAELINDIDALAVAADNDSYNEDDRHNLAIEIDQKLESLTSLMNASHNDRFLFGGHQTLSAPFSFTRNDAGRLIGVVANQETLHGKIYRRISENEDIQINVSGDELFQPIGAAGTSDDLVHVVAVLRDTIGNNNVPPAGEEDTLSNHALRDSLSLIRERITSRQANLGGVGQRLQQTLSEIMQTEIHLTDEVEQSAGVDLTSLATDLAIEEGAYNALMAASPRLLKSSLVDYLL